MFHVYVVTLKGWGRCMFAEYHYILHWIRLLLGKSSQSLILFAGVNFVYTPLKLAFTGESLTIPDFVRENLFTEFGEFLLCSRNIVKLS